MDRALHNITNSLLASPTTTFLPEKYGVRSDARTAKLAEIKASRNEFLKKVNIYCI